MAEEGAPDVAALLARIEQQDERIEYLEDMVESLVNTVNEFQAFVKTQLPQHRRDSAGKATHIFTRRSTVGELSKPSDKSPKVHRRTSSCHSEFAEELPGVPIYGTCYGYLNKLSAGISKNWKRRWFLLKDDGTLLYYKTAKASTEEGAIEHGRIELSGYTILKTTDAKFGFRASHPTHRAFVLSAETDDDRARWMAALDAAAAKREGCAQEPVKFGGWLRRDGSPVYCVLQGDSLVVAADADLRTVFSSLNVGGATITCDQPTLTFQIKPADGASVSLKADNADLFGRWAQQLQNDDSPC
eukprot:m.19893 g.19893  ORF g.19893 m.19893 type:complete len:301 (+) comp7685_c0_seq1:68-970(+)